MAFFVHANLNRLSLDEPYYNNTKLNKKIRTKSKMFYTGRQFS